MPENQAETETGAPEAERAADAPHPLFVGGRELLEIIIALGLLALAASVVLSIHTVRTRDMAPGYLPGQSLLVSRLTYQLREPERGELVLMTDAQNASVARLRRVIGLPGETVELRGEPAGPQAVQAAVNGRPLIEPYVNAQFQSNAVITTTEIIRLRRDEFLIMQDNRAAAIGARSWDIVQSSQLAGRAWLVIYPLDALTLIGNTFTRP